MTNVIDMTTRTAIDTSKITRQRLGGKAAILPRTRKKNVELETVEEHHSEPIKSLEDINRSARCVVQLTLTTWDDGLCAVLEPNVCNTKRRVEVLAEMQRRSIPTLVWLSPILPFLNDTMENLDAILDACVRTGVKGIVCFGMGLTLREGNREYFYAALDRHFPGLRERYVRCYGNAYELLSPNAAALEKRFHQTCRENGMLHTPEDCFAFLREFPEKFEQLRLF